MSLSKSLTFLAWASEPDPRLVPALFRSGTNILGCLKRNEEEVEAGWEGRHYGQKCVRLGRIGKIKNVQTLKKFFHLKTMFLAEHKNAFKINSEAFACPSTSEKLG